MTGRTFLRRVPFLSVVFATAILSSPATAQMPSPEFAYASGRISTYICMASETSIRFDRAGAAEAASATAPVHADFRLTRIACEERHAMRIHLPATDEAPARAIDLLVLRSRQLLVYRGGLGDAAGTAPSLLQPASYDSAAIVPSARPDKTAGFALARAEDFLDPPGDLTAYSRSSAFAHTPPPVDGFDPDLHTGSLRTGFRWLADVIRGRD